MDAHEFHRLAGALVARSGAGPSHLRTAISRAYYSAYHASLQVIGKLGVRVSRGPRAHTDLRNAWGAIDHAIARQLAAQLGDLHSKRLNADYDLDRIDVESVETARTYVALGETLLRSLEGILREPLRAELATAIQQARDNGALG